MRDSMKMLLRTWRTERDAYSWLEFNDRATGDAIIFIAVTQLLTLIGTFRALRVFLDADFFTLALSFVVDALFFWLILSGLAFAVVKFLFQENLDFAFVLRLTGFAYPTRLLRIAAVAFLQPTTGSTVLIAGLLGTIWFGYIVAKGLDHAVEIGLARGALAVVGAYAGYLIISSILSGFAF
ncbi:MAG: hypothetical protein HKN07_07295 [Acidimicrobiia bacterium]|nr:hypothetical protein [Acidimicrobiia bacterium]NNF64050.1 hypothetical protein [Acidimicrobiia bacterium]